MSENGKSCVQEMTVAPSRSGTVCWDFKVEVTHVVDKTHPEARSVLDIGTRGPNWSLAKVAMCQWAG